MISRDFQDRETTAALADWVVGDTGIELMTIATWHPFETIAAYRGFSARDDFT
jgi:hypothetical protein